MGRATPAAAPARARSRLDELLDWQVSPEPIGGRLYPIRAGDTPMGVAREVLRNAAEGAPVSQRMCVEYVWLYSANSFALRLYGSDSTSRRFPAALLVPHLAQGCRVAFLPRNADAIDWMRAGLLPPRTVDPDGRSLGIGESRGTLWLAPVCPEHLRRGIVTCSPFSWPDGSSTLEPDPELLALLDDPT